MRSESQWWCYSFWTSMCNWILQQENLSMIPVGNYMFKVNYKNTGKGVKYAQS